MDTHLDYWFTNKNQILKSLSTGVWKVGFQLMQILGLLGIYFDAEVVFVTNFIQIVKGQPGHLCTIQNMAILEKNDPV